MQAVGANVAYDFSRFDNRYTVREQVRKERTAEQAKRQSGAKKKSAISGFSVFAFLVCMGLILVTLFSYVQLTELSDTGMKLRSQLRETQEEAQLLAIQRDQKYSVAQIKEEAESRLGMQKLDKSQITYLDLGASDHVEIIHNTQTMRDSHLVAGIVDGLQWIVSYIN